MKSAVLFTSFFILLLSFSVRAQTGGWYPVGALTSYPRTLLTAEAVPAVRASLAAPAARVLYKGLYESSLAAPPADNTTASGRRARATFAKNGAFLLLMARRPVADSLVAWPEVERAAYQQQVQTVLETLNPAVEPFASFNGTTYTEWQWRSKELIDYLIAYDLLRGSQLPAASLQTARQQLQQFAGNLYRESNKPFLGVYFYRQVKNNHTLMTAAALGMAAVVLNDAASADVNLQPASWGNAALFHLDNVLWEDAQRQSDPAAVAGYAEGPYYFKYAFLNCLPFIRAVGQFAPGARFTCTYNGTTRTIPNPYTDPRYERLYQWATAITMPDGRLPALEDSYVDMAMPELALTGQPRFTPTLALSRLSAGQLNSLQAQLRDATVDMRAAYLAALPTPAGPAAASLTHLPRSGNLIFRSGADSLATYFHLYGKSGAAQDNSGGHSQADASSFILQAQGQLLALDAGYLSYSRRAEVGQATNHNLVLVDGAGPTIGTSGAANDAAVTLPTAFATPGLLFGEAQTAYRNASITRKALFVRNEYVLLADFASSVAPHTYTWQLHGYGLEGGSAATGLFQGNFGNQEATWTKNGVQLLAHVTTPGAAANFGQATNVHELTYNTTENHTTLLVQSPVVARTQFLAALHPTTTRAAGTTRFVTRSTTTTAALSASSRGYQDAAFTQADTVQTTVLSLPQPLTADALLTFVAVDSVGQAAQAFMDQGTVLRYGPDTLVQASRRATVSWQLLGQGRYAGYVNRATTLVVAVPSAPAQVLGAAISSYAYNARTQRLTIRLSGASDIAVQTAARPLPVTLVQFTGRRQAQAVTLRWQTAAEINNHGFVVQRSTSSAPAFRAVGEVAAQGGPASYTFTDAAAPTETVYYRLQQHDADGSVTYSGVVTVGAVTSALSLQAAPVPANTEVRITVSGAVPLSGTLQLLDSRGRLLVQQPLQPLTTLPTATLPAGLYFVRAVDTTGKPMVPAVKVLLEH